VAGFVFDIPPDNYVFPSCKEAFKEASQVEMQSAWSTGAVYNARMAVGVLRCRYPSESTVRRFDKRYLEFCSMTRRGEALPRHCWAKPYEVKGVDPVVLPVVRLRNKGVAASGWLKVKDILK